jgi:hypothetical protein
MSMLLAAASLAGCVATTDIGAPKFGSRLVLHQQLTIQSGWARAFIQHGRPVLHAELASFDPFCSLETRTVAGDGISLQVRPGTFEVTRTVRQHPPGGVFAGMLNPDEDFGPVMLELDIYLESPEQPDVLRLRCNRLEPDPAFARPIGPIEVREVLGSVATLE